MQLSDFIQGCRYTVLRLASFLILSKYGKVLCCFESVEFTLIIKRGNRLSLKLAALSLIYSFTSDEINSREVGFPGLAHIVELINIWIITLSVTFSQ